MYNPYKSLTPSVESVDGKFCYPKPVVLPGTVSSDGTKERPLKIGTDATAELDGNDIVIEYSGENLPINVGDTVVFDTFSSKIKAVQIGVGNDEIYRFPANFETLISIQSSIFDGVQFLYFSGTDVSTGVTTLGKIDTLSKSLVWTKKLTPPIGDLYLDSELILTSDALYILLINTDSYQAAEIFKLDLSGALLWSKDFEKSGPSTRASIKILSDGRLLVLYIKDTSRELAVTELNPSNGNEIATYLVSETGESSPYFRDLFSNIGIDENDNIFVFCRVPSSSNGFLLKIETTTFTCAGFKSTSAFGGYCSCITDSNGNVYFTYPPSGILYKFDNDLNLIFAKIFKFSNGNTVSYINSLAIDESDNVYILPEGSSCPENPNPSKNPLLFLKVNENGDVISTLGISEDTANLYPWWNSFPSVLEYKNGRVFLGAVEYSNPTVGNGIIISLDTEFQNFDTYDGITLFSFPITVEAATPATFNAANFDTDPGGLSPGESSTLGAITPDFEYQLLGIAPGFTCYGNGVLPEGVFWFSKIKQKVEGAGINFQQYAAVGNYLVLMSDSLEPTVQIAKIVEVGSDYVKVEKGFVGTFSDLAVMLSVGEIKGISLKGEGVVNGIDIESTDNPTFYQESGLAPVYGDGTFKILIEQ